MMETRPVRLNYCEPRRTTVGARRRRHLFDLLYPAYVRGQALLAQYQGGVAAVEFQKILNWPGVVLNEPIGALAHLGLARAQ